MTEEDEELEELRKKKLLEIQMQQQQAALQQQAAEEQAHAAEQQKQMILKRILDPDAKSRLTRIKLAHPEFATAVEDQLIMLAQSGRLDKVISDAELKEILKKVQPKKRDITITRR
jgi:programmed cell death protein 5